MRLEGSIIIAVWPQMFLAMAVAIGGSFLRQYQGPDTYIITDVKGHATLGTTLAFLNVFRSNLSYGRCVVSTLPRERSAGVVVVAGSRLALRLRCCLPLRPWFIEIFSDRLLVDTQLLGRPWAAGVSRAVGARADAHGRDVHARPRGR